MCAMTGLNIQSLLLLEDGVIIWHVFIEILRYYGTKAVGRTVKIFPVLDEGFIRCQEARQARGQASLEVSKVRIYEGRPFRVKVLFSNCRSLPSCSDITSSCKTQVSGAAATLPLSLCEREQLLTSLRVIRDAGEGFIGCQEVKLLSVLRTKITSVTSLPSCPPNFCSSVNNPLPQSLPQGREAEKCASLLTLHTSLKKQAAFTLAEVLITLGIIGVVAAMTMPALIQNYQKKQTAVRLERFYSIMSQAVLRWQQDEGTIPEDIKFPADAIKNGEKTKEWFASSIGKYMTTVSQKTNGQNFSVALNDGSGFDSYVGSTSQLNIFFCTDYKYCSKAKSREGNFDGKHGFLFTICNGKFYASLPGHQYSTREQLLRSCKYGNTDNPNVSSKGRRHACARLIQMDGWEIRDDYPWEQTILEN